MFIKNWKAQVVENTKTIKKHCDICDNESEHSICVEYYGPSVGLIFMSKPLLSMKRYWLVCSICKQGNQEISKEQVEAYKIK